MSLSRRALLALPAVTALAACEREAANPTPTRNGSPRPTATPRSLPPQARYTPLGSEPLPKLKQAAADFVQTLGTTTPTAPSDKALAAAGRAAGPALDLVALRRVSAALYEETTTTTEVVYPQFAGLAPMGPGARRAAIMVVARHRSLGPRGAVDSVVRVHDVRLQVVDGAWRVTELAAIGGEPVARPRDLDGPAKAVLDSDRIELPDSARWDIHAGRVDLRLLDVLLSAAKVSPVSVAVLRSGHPLNVFGTTRRSDHTAGRAVDIWRIGGRPVVEQVKQPGSPQRLVQRAVFALPALRQLGSPPGSDLDGPRRRSFSDLVHVDHLHLAASTTSPRSG